MKALKFLLFASLVFLFSGFWGFVLHILIGTTPLTGIASLGTVILLFWLFYLREDGTENE